MIQLLADLCFASIITMMVFYVFRSIGTIYHDHMWRKLLWDNDLRPTGRANFDVSAYATTTYDNMANAVPNPYQNAKSFVKISWHKNF
jgi:hypothetical protein